MGCEKVDEDKASGAKASRKGLNLALEVLRTDDTLVVWKLDRIGRSVKNLVATVGDIEQRGIHFKSLTDNINTLIIAGRFFFHIITSLAQMERELMIERTCTELEAARKRGRVGGRKRVMTDSKINQDNCIFILFKPYCKRKLLWIILEKIVNQFPTRHCLMSNYILSLEIQVLH
ncbi:MAG: recombinase family protein [Methylococcaceae bacterium]